MHVIKSIVMTESRELVIRHGVCVITCVSETASEAEKRSFLNEVNVMKSVGRHVNVIALIGCCTKLGRGQLTVMTSFIGCECVQ